MSNKSKRDAASVSGAVVIGLPADCRIAGLGALRQQLGEAQDASPCTLDASAVERVDTAALQLLFAYRSAMQARGSQMAWAGVGAPLQEAARLLGLTEILALPAALPA